MPNLKELNDIFGRISVTNRDLIEETDCIVRDYTYPVPEQRESEPEKESEIISHEKEGTRKAGTASAEESNEDFLNRCKLLPALKRVDVQTTLNELGLSVKTVQATWMNEDFETLLCSDLEEISIKTPAEKTMLNKVKLLQSATFDTISNATDFRTICGKMEEVRGDNVKDRRPALSTRLAGKDDLNVYLLLIKSH